MIRFSYNDSKDTFMKKLSERFINDDFHVRCEGPHYHDGQLLDLDFINRIREDSRCFVVTIYGKELRFTRNHDSWNDFYDRVTKIVDYELQKLNHYGRCRILKYD